MSSPEITDLPAKTRLSPIQIDILLLVFALLATISAAGRVLFDSHPSLLAQPNGTERFITWGVVVALAPLFVAVSWYLDERPLRAWARGWVCYALLIAVRMHLRLSCGDATVGGICGIQTEIAHSLSLLNNVFFFYSGLVSFESVQRPAWRKRIAVAIVVALLGTWILPNTKIFESRWLSEKYLWNQVPNTVCSILTLMMLGAGQRRLLTSHLNRAETPRFKVRVATLLGSIWLILAIVLEAVVQIAIPLMDGDPPNKLTRVITVLSPVILLLFASTQPLLFLARKFYRFDRLIDRSHIAHFVVGEDGLTAETSRRELEILDYSAEDRLAGQCRADLFVKHGRWDEITNLFRNPKSKQHRGREQLRRKDGTCVEVDMSIWRTSDGSYAGYYTDATTEVIEESLERIVNELSWKRTTGPTVIRDVLDQVIKVTGASHAFAFAKEYAHEFLLRRYSVSPPPESTSSETLPLRDEDRVNARARCEAHKDGTTVCALCRDTVGPRHGEGDQRVGACLAIPVVHTNGLTGLVILQFPKMPSWWPTMQQSLEHFGRSVGILLAGDVHLDLGDFHENLRRVDADATTDKSREMLRSLVDRLGARVPVRRWFLAISEDDWGTALVSSDAPTPAARADRPLQSAWAELSDRRRDALDILLFRGRDEVSRALRCVLCDEPATGETLLAIRVGTGDDLRAVLLLVDRQPAGFSEFDGALVRRFADLLALVLGTMAVQQRLTARWLQVAHEFSSPVQMVRVETDDALAALGARDLNTVEMHLKAIDTQAVLLNEQLTQFEATERGLSLVTAVGPTDLVAEVLDVVRRDIAPWLVTEALPAEGVRFHIQDRLPRLELDPNALRHALMNLLRNAIRYRSPDPGTFQVDLYANPTDGGVELRVEDRGIGIPEAWRERVFEKGQRAPNAAARSRRGLGVGLAVVRQIVQDLGGTVRVENCASPTIFVITIGAGR